MTDGMFRSFPLMKQTKIRRHTRPVKSKIFSLSFSRIIHEAYHFLSVTVKIRRLTNLDRSYLQDSES